MNAHPRHAAAAWLAREAHRVAQLFLCLWALGLAVAAVELDQWRREISRTLVQLSADEHFRESATRRRDAIDPEWHRRKAVSLLAATGRLHADGWWTVFVPGSWSLFDDLEEQVQARIEREFGRIVVDTVRRELHARASNLTGVARFPGGELRPDAPCRPPSGAPGMRRLSGAMVDLPEFRALDAFVRDLEPLDEAVRALQTLRQGDMAAAPQRLHRLVTYTLDADPPGSLLRGVRLFDSGGAVDVQPILLQARLQAAARCTFDKGLEALYARLLAGNDLFALERALAEHSAGLFAADARPAGYERTLERYRAVAALLEDQDALLAAGGNAWMRHGIEALGPAWRELVERAGRIELLGPAAVQRLQGRSAATDAAFRRQFEALYGAGVEPGIVWVEAERRFAQSPSRAALRRGLAALLKQPFMSDEAGRRPAADLAGAIDAANSLAADRARFAGMELALFPAEPRAAVARVVDARVADLVYQDAFRALKAAIPPPATPIDPAQYRVRHALVAVLRSHLEAVGAHALGARLQAALETELLQRLAALQDQANRLPLLAALQGDASQGPGEPLTAWRVLGATDAAGLHAALATQAASLEALGAQAAEVLALGSPRLAQEPAARQWVQLLDELQRFRERQPESSLARWQDDLLALGADFHRDNCAQRLDALGPLAAGEDEIGRRRQQWHRALLARCAQLRTASPAGPA